MRVASKTTDNFRRTQAVVSLRVGTLLALVFLLPAGFRSLALSQARAENDSTIAGLAQQADTDLHNQRIVQAAEKYRKILALDPDNLSAHSNLGLAYYLQGSYAQAVSEFHIALGRKPDLWNIAALCGESEAKLGQNTDATIHLRQAFQNVSEPSLRRSAGKQLFSILFQAGDLSEAASVAGQLEKLEPKNVDVYYAEHQVYSEMADKAFLAAARLDPGSARMYQLRGDRMARMGNLAGAIAAYRLAIDHDPHLSGAHFVLAEALSTSPSAAERAEAEAEYEKALIDNPLDERAECSLGEIALDRSDTQGASAHFKRALQLQPDDPDANEGMGMVLLQSDSAHEARTYLLRAVDLDPGSSTAHYHLSRADRKLGDLDAARHEMDEFLRLKAEKENLTRAFHDLPIRIQRQGSQDSGDSPQPQQSPTATTGPEYKPNR